jgi:uncharacterized phage protein gp47/JayE
MAFVKKSYEEIRDNILAQITKGIVNERHVYEPSRTRYKLANAPVKSIVRVEGIMDGARHAFVEGVDYQLAVDMLEWLTEGDSPDDGTAFSANYVFGSPSSITDINPGSVVRTMVEAVSREMDFLYEQLNQVYLAGFMDTATGSALDLVASILGVRRRSAGSATGRVIFGRSTDPAEIQVSREAHLYDGKAIYEMESVPVKSVAKVGGVVEGSSYTFEQGVDYAVVGKGVEWSADGKKPDYNQMFYVDYVAYEQVKIPSGITVSTYSPTPEEVKVYVTTEDRVLERAAEGAWEADVSVKALATGRAGNIYAGMITVMPQPLMGVEYVVNREDILNGTDEESDEELRARARRALEVAGKATLISLEAAVRGVEGVSSMLVEDMPDGVQGLVRIITDGGDEDEIRRVIDDVRAAGIRVELLRPQAVHLDVIVSIALQREAKLERVKSDVEAKVRSYISSLRIGEDVIYRRVVGAAMSVKGVYDVDEVTVKAYRQEREEAITSTKENIALSSGERAVPRTVNVLVKTSQEKKQ